MRPVTKAITTNVEATGVDAAQRLLVALNGCSVAVVEFYLFGKVAIVTHTEVDSGQRGQGLGAIAAGQALEHFRSQNWTVVPICGFFLEHVRRHPNYAGLLTPHCRRIFAV